MAKALLIDPLTGDIDITLKRFRLTSTNAEYVVQRITQRLSLCLGEWYLDQHKGVPFFRYILVKNPDMGLIRSIYSRIIRGTAGVVQLLTLETTLNRATRTLDVVFSCKLDTGEIIPNTSVYIPFG
jgi:hypothetical protein